MLVALPSSCETGGGTFLTIRSNGIQVLKFSSETCELSQLLLSFLELLVHESDDLGELRSNLGNLCDGFCFLPGTKGTEFTPDVGNEVSPCSGHFDHLFEDLRDLLPNAFSNLQKVVFDTLKVSKRIVHLNTTKLDLKEGLVSQNLNLNL